MPRCGRETNQVVYVQSSSANEMSVSPFKFFLFLNKISVANSIYLLLPMHITYIGIYEFVNFPSGALYPT